MPSDWDMLVRCRNQSDYRHIELSHTYLTLCTYLVKPSPLRSECAAHCMIKPVRVLPSMPTNMAISCLEIGAISQCYWVNNMVIDAGI